MLNEETIRNLPKVELHDHLDGGLRPETVIEIAKRRNIKLPTYDPQELKEWFSAGCNRKSLVLYLEGFSATTAVMQTEEDLERVAYEAVLDLKEEDVVSSELRFCPALHTELGLTMEKVVSAVLKGIREAKADCSIILCAMRNKSTGESEEIARLAVRKTKDGVVGFDLAGAELGNSAEKHRGACEIARAGGLGITIHAGEADGISSIKSAVLTCKADRIGHGVKIMDEIEAKGGEIIAMGDFPKLVLERQIPLEMCLTSNVGTGAVKSYEEHPFPLLLKAGFNVCLSSDNRLMSDTNLTKEMVKASECYSLTTEDLKKVTQNAFNARFVPR